ncbi:hypothetical protein OJJOAM_004064 [Cupriavidus sp. H18C1]
MKRLSERGSTALLNADPLWYKDAVIYQLHIKSFYDANGDGVGDFAGLLAKLDYLVSLGVDTIWLLPFYPSPRRDDGYDIADYRNVHPEYGTLAEARRFIAAAHARGLRVITELVINHTSDQHPWFQRARHAKPGSAARNYYVWSDTDQAYSGTRIIFCDTEKSNWSWDPVAGAYFWHRFYSHQPDLNFDNPLVLRDVLSVMRFWLDMGIDGLRLDAVPYLVEREGTSNENLPETHTVIRQIRKHLDDHYQGRLLLAEANMWPEDAQQYFGGAPATGERPAHGDECHMAFHFPLMPRMYMAIAREDRFPITDIIRQTPEIPPNCQWAIFLRNHDELTLEMVTSSERDYLWEVYASDRRARINLGIRRRLAPLMERDRRRIELMNSLLFSMPGTPVIYYGDEIGMGDNIHLGDRDGVRTPMQWSPDRNGGFSHADPERLVLPPLQGPLYGYEAVNVEAQSRDTHSLLNWMRRMLALRRQHRAFGRGSFRFLFPGNRKILAYLREYEGEHILCVANLSRAPQAVELDLSEFEGRVPVEMLGATPFPAIGQLTYLLTLPPYGFYWFVLSTEAQPPSWHVDAPQQMPELITLIMQNTAQADLTEASRRILSNEVLPDYIGRRRWFGAKSEKIQGVTIAYAVPFGAAAPGEAIYLSEVEVALQGRSECYQLPVSVLWDHDAPRRQRAAAGARAGDGARAPRQPRRAGHRRLRGRALRAGGRQGPSRRHRDRHAARPDPLPRRTGTGGAGPGGRSDPVDVRRAVEQLAVVQQLGGAQAGAARLRRHPSRSRDDALPDRAGLRQCRRAARRSRAHRRGRHAAHADAAAGLHPEPGRRLELDTRLYRPRHRRCAADGERERRRRVHRGDARLCRDGDDAGPAPGRAACGAGAAQRGRGVHARAGRRGAGARVDRRRDGRARHRAAADERGRRPAAAGRDRRALPRRRAGGARQPRAAARTGRLARRGGAGQPADAHSRRPASGAGADRAERHLHHRLRGRTGPAAGLPPPQDLAAARCRGHPALVRLCRRHRRHRPQRAHPFGAAAGAGRAARRTARALPPDRDRRLPRRLPRGGGHRAAPVGQRGTAAAAARPVPAGARRLRGQVRGRQPGDLDRPAGAWTGAADPHADRRGG